MLRANGNTFNAMLTETAYAKINLALHVRAKRADGYHALETIFAFTQDGDILTAEAADEISLTIDGPFAEGLAANESNLVIRAAKALQAAAAVTQGARLHLAKNLPVASGVGGGSADAAATLRLLVRLWEVQITHQQLLQVAFRLGADVPACLTSQTMRGEGVGEILLPLSAEFADLPILLVNPRIPLSTAAVFKRWDGQDRGELGHILPPATLRHHEHGSGSIAQQINCDPAAEWMLKQVQRKCLLAIADNARNDLTAPAILIAPVIGEVLHILSAPSDVLITRMSGSGATCFALFADIPARDFARDTIAATHPHWWTLASTLR